MVRLMLKAFLGCALLSSTAWASIGWTTCTNADGSIRREEKEIWGTNEISWFYQGEAISADQVTVESDGPQVNEEISTNEEMGQERIETRVLKVAIKPAAIEAGEVNDYIICRTTAYPEIYD